MPSCSVTVETWPVAGTFAISRGSRTEAIVVVAELDDGEAKGRGECVPYARYGETVESVVGQIQAAAAAGLTTRSTLAAVMPAGAARNALDCALLDLEAKRADRPAAAIVGVASPAAGVATCYTISLADPATMAAKAREAAHMPLLKLKLGGDGDAERLAAVRQARPDARLVADANEAWTVEQLPELLAAARDVGVEMIEQPLPAGHDAALALIERPLPICADESVHTAADVRALADRYDAVNIKLDKAGGLTEALAMARAARAAGLKIMVGCMLSTSLAIAPAWLLAGDADWVDLDGPLLLARDRATPVPYRDGRILPPPRALWG